jgi:flagellar protein FliO/FliZ
MNRSRHCAGNALLATLLLMAACLAVGQAAAADPAASRTETATTAGTTSTGADDLAFLSDNTGKTANSDMPDMGAAAMRMVITMLVLCGLLVGGMVLFNRYARRRLKLGGGERPLRVLDRVQLGPKKSVCILNACGRRLLLGVGERDVTLLLELDLPEDSATPANFSGELTQAARNEAATHSGVQR